MLKNTSFLGTNREVLSGETLFHRIGPVFRRIGPRVSPDRTFSRTQRSQFEETPSNWEAVLTREKNIYSCP